MNSLASLLSMIFKEEEDPPLGFEYFNLGMTWGHSSLPQPPQLGHFSQVPWDFSSPHLYRHRVDDGHLGGSVNPKMTNLGSVVPASGRASQVTLESLLVPCGDAARQGSHV